MFFKKEKPLPFKIGDDVRLRDAIISEDGNKVIQFGSLFKINKIELVKKWLKTHYLVTLNNDDSSITYLLARPSDYISCFVVVKK